MPKDYEVKNLLNEKNVILHREDIFKIAKYAIENNIIDIVLVDNEFNYFSIHDNDDIQIDNIILVDSEEAKDESINT
jgi:hypothetical protein